LCAQTQQQNKDDI